MLAHEYTERAAARVAFPCYVQPKLDGVRLLAALDVRDGAVQLTSRSGTDFSHLLPLLSDDVMRALDALGGDARQRQGQGQTLALDGELYIHDVPFQRIVSLVRSRDASRALEEGLQYHVYDFVPSSPGMTFAQRHAALLGAWPTRLSRTVLVETKEVASARGVEAALKRYERLGYEGVMIRAGDSAYALGKRSAGLLKYKRFKTDEFVVVGVREAAGKDKGTPVFECETPGGQRFSVRPTGTLQERRELYARAAALVGRMLTVKFQELTADGIPRFPVALEVRDYE